MYSNIKSVQLLLAALKAHGIRHIVLSPGGSDIPVVHSIETDPFFQCFSVVDERSAVYFGIGLSQSQNAPVACVCTSGTAASNFLPGLTEAYYQNVPIIAITADKNPYFLNQIETQKTNQVGLYGEVCKKAVDLTLCENGTETWYSRRLIREALFELTHHGTGPVHINIPIVGNTGIFNQKSLPSCPPIELVQAGDDADRWKAYAKRLAKARRILVVVGQNERFTADDERHLELFFHSYRCLISVEHLSNLHTSGAVYTYPVTEIYRENLGDELKPDIVVSCGNNVASYNMKPFLRKHCDDMEHWTIDEGGRPRDTFMSLKVVFECGASCFFARMAEAAEKDWKNDMEYYGAWKAKADGIVIPEFPFSNLYVASQLSSCIPPHSILHLAVLNSIRVMQFFHIEETVRVFCNVGALGIDGCLSTFIGQAAATDALAFCVVGDLSFFYDMNAAGIRHVRKNVRILLLNNGGGSEFQFFMGREKIPTINRHICAEHHKTAKGWVESLGYRYYSASTKEELNRILPHFIGESDKPVFVEVFTDMEEDAKNTKTFYYQNQPQDLQKGLKKVAKSILSPKQLSTMMNIYDHMKK